MPLKQKGGEINYSHLRKKRKCSTAAREESSNIKGLKAYLEIKWYMCRSVVKYLKRLHILLFILLNCIFTLSQMFQTMFKPIEISSFIQGLFKVSFIGSLVNGVISP